MPGLPATLRSPLLEAMAAAVSLAVPVGCAGCGQPDVALCSACGRALSPGQPFSVTDAVAVADLRVFAMTHYAGAARRIMVGAKDGGRVGVRGAVAAALADAVAAAAGTVLPAGAAVVLVPVPSCASSSRRRGGDYTADLAARTARCLRRSGAAVRAVRALAHARRVNDQAGLGVAARQANVRGAMTLRAGAANLLREAQCLVVDDIVTTGSTLAEAVRALSAAGLSVPAAAVVAATAYRGGRAAGGDATGPPRSSGGDSPDCGR